MAIRILVADDHALVRSTLSSLIRNSRDNWEVCGEAEDGQAAVQMAVDLKPDLAILDFRMPHRDGLSAGREIRARVPGIRMLLFSLTEGSCLETAAQAAGFQGVVEKSGRTIVQAIQKALDSEGAAEPRRSAVSS
ncbi:MAG: response regulator transcription factor [Candidatus Acidiferrales bacterium]